MKERQCQTHWDCRHVAGSGAPGEGQWLGARFPPPALLSPSTSAGQASPPAYLSRPASKFPAVSNQSWTAWNKKLCVLVSPAQAASFGCAGRSSVCTGTHNVRHPGLVRLVVFSHLWSEKSPKIQSHKMHLLNWTLIVFMNCKVLLRFCYSHLQIVATWEVN